MPRILQEKFQVSESVPKEDGANSWASEASARVAKTARSSFNVLPPGMDIEAQTLADTGTFGSSTNGNMPSGKNAGDVTSHEVNATSLRKGFDKKPLLQTDDEYTRSHNDAFYDDVGGFVERNNMMDRL